MLPPFRPAVFACPMRYMHTEKPKRVWPPPYPAWPEITDPSTLYTLPTLASHPAITLCLWHPSWWDNYLNSVDCYTDRELVYVMFPDYAEEILAKFPPTAEDNYTMTLELAMDLLGSQALSSGQVLAFAATGNANPEWSEFAINHEMGHFCSFEIPRPTILEVNRIASGIFDLFKKLSLSNLTARENFWDEFQKGNNTLVNYLDKALILEEVRANLYAFWALDPRTRVTIEPDLRKVMAEDAISLFDTLANVTNEDWYAAFRLSLLAEYAPEDPLKRLHFLSKRGADDNSVMLLQEAIARWWDDPGWSVQFEEPMYGTPEIDFTPPDEYAVSAVHHWSLSDVRELVFLESLRQQLAQFSGVSLVCPFRQKGRTCCGFGHYMRAIWEQVRPEHRSVKAVLHPKTGKEIVVRPPRKACLHYGLC
jgi:hypothetical protein